MLQVWLKSSGIGYLDYDAASCSDSCCVLASHYNVAASMQFLCVVTLNSICDKIGVASAAVVGAYRL